MLRLLNCSFNGDIHCFFYYKHQSLMPFRFRKHKGHDLAYDVNIITSHQRLSIIVTSTFL